MTKLPARRRTQAPPVTINIDAAQVTDRIGKLKLALAGSNPATQAAVLADLVATFLAGHHPHFREQLLMHHMQTVRDLVPDNERAMFEAGYPAGWPQTR